jgi:archaellum component FlaC
MNQLNQIPATHWEMGPDSVLFFCEWNHLQSEDGILRCNYSEISLHRRSMSKEEMEEIKRHFGVVAESLRSDIRQIAEGHAVIRHELQSQREEMRGEFNETRALMRLSFSQLDQRILMLESDVTSLKSRMDRLESSRA